MPEIDKLVEFNILLLLKKKKSMFGTEILNSLNKGRLFNIQTGTFYAILTRLENKKNFIESEWERDEEIPNNRSSRRKFYSLTSNGQDTLQEYIEHFREIL